MKAGWTTVPMAELCSIQSGKSDTKDSVPDGPYAFFDRSKTIKRSSRFLRDCEALIIPGEGAEFLPRYFNGKFDLHQRAYALFDFSPKLDVRFLFYYLHHTADYFPRVAVGATVKSLRLRHFEELPVAITSLPEQQRIVTLLDEAFDGIATAKAHAEKNLQNARAIFESHLQSVFTQRGDGWISTTIGESCTLKSGTTVPVSIEKQSGDIPYVKVAEMTLSDNQDGITTSIRFLDRPDVKPGWFIPKGAVIFPKRGGAILTNKKRLALVDMCADLNIMSVIPSESITPEFLYFYFLTVDMRKLGTGSSIPQINNYDIAPLEISFPKSLTKQAEIADSIRSLESECQALESIYQRKLTALDELKKSLLHRAFNGDL